MDLLTGPMIGDDKLSTLSRSPIRVCGVVGCNQLDLTLSSFAPPPLSTPRFFVFFFFKPHHRWWLWHGVGVGAV